MELLQLKYFCDAAQSENFSHTARKYHVPTSNISQTIKRLERELGAELFTRRKNRISLSEQGRIFYQSAHSALDKLDEAQRRLADFDDAVGGEIKILALTNRRIIAKTIERFKTDYPAVSFILSHSQTADAGGFDIIIADDSFYAENYAPCPLIREDILLAVSKEHPLANTTQLSLSELKNERFISMPVGSSLHSVIVRICRSAGFTPQIAIESDDPYYLRKYIELGLGVSFVPSLTWKGEIPDSIALKPLDGFERKTCVFLPADRYLTKPVRLFTRMLSETAKNY